MSKSPLSEKKFMRRIAISGKEILLAHSYEDSQITISTLAQLSIRFGVQCEICVDNDRKNRETCGKRICFVGCYCSIKLGKGKECKTRRLISAFCT